MEKVFYKTDEQNECTTLCEFSNEDVDVYIGSLLCKQCKQNISYEAEEKWIKCEIYSAFVENKLLREESDARFKYIVEQTKKIEQLEKEIASLKGGL